MKATGPLEERETIITFNDATDTASIYTASDKVYKRLRARGWFPALDGQRHAVFEVDKAAIKLPRPGKGVKVGATRSSSGVAGSARRHDE